MVDKESIIAYVREYGELVAYLEDDKFVHHVVEGNFYEILNDLPPSLVVDRSYGYSPCLRIEINSWCLFRNVVVKETAFPIYRFIKDHPDLEEAMLDAYFDHGFVYECYLAYYETGWKFSMFVFREYTTLGHISITNKVKDIAGFVRRKLDAMY